MIYVFNIAGLVTSSFHCWCVDQHVVFYYLDLLRMLGASDKFRKSNSLTEKICCWFKLIVFACMSPLHGTKIVDKLSRSDVTINENQNAFDLAPLSQACTAFFVNC